MLDLPRFGEHNGRAKFRKELGNQYARDLLSETAVILVEVQAPVLIRNNSTQIGSQG